MADDPLVVFQDMFRDTCGRPCTTSTTKAADAPLTLEALAAACRAAAQSLLDHPRFNGIIVAPGTKAELLAAVREDRRAAMWGVKVTESPLMPRGKAALTLGGQVVDIIDLPAASAQDQGERE